MMRSMPLKLSLGNSLRIKETIYIIKIINKKIFKGVLRLFSRFIMGILWFKKNLIINIKEIKPKLISTAAFEKVTLNNMNQIKNS